MPEIQEISHTHEAIMNFMIANPALSMGQVAAHFGYTQAWLSTMTRSSCFKARFAEKLGMVNSVVVQGLREKLETVADIGVDKLMRHIEESDDPKFVKETTDMVLHRLGFAPSKGGVNVNVQAENVQQNFVASREDLQLARQAMGAVGLSSSPLSLPVEAGPGSPE